MATTPTSGNQILVDAPGSTASASMAQPGGALTSWVLGKVTNWEQARDRGYSRLWAEYWRMWRGKWSEEDRNRLSERSRLIAPALAQAIEQTVSEIEEALFAKDCWFDVVDDIKDEEKIDALLARDQLLEDFDHVNVKDAISEAVLNAAIFGTGIVKVNVTVARDEKPVRDEFNRLEAKGPERVFVSVESIRPDEFIPDPSGKNIQQMLGCAHRVRTPLHSVLEKIETGAYRKDALATLAPQRRTDNKDVDQATDPQSNLMATDSDEVDLIEYHGKVPLALLNEVGSAKTALDEILAADFSLDPDRGYGTLVEAIVTIANGSVLLRAIPIPFIMKDRSVIAFQFERVPGRFWGRGVSEKGYNPQKALDAEMRARADALGFISSPMLGVDAGRVPRGFKLEIKPGKVWLTQGPPGEVLQPISVGDLNSNTFNQSSELERMVQMGTGAFDTASAIKSQSASGSNSLSANSMLMGAFVKRAKRSIHNVDRNLVTPIIQKAMWRYMQFDPVRYPQDFQFRVKSTMGIMAREVEAMQMTQLIGMIPEQYGEVSLALVQGVIEHTALPNKADIMKIINKAMQPPDPETLKKQQELQEMQLEAVKAQAQGELLKNQKTLAEIRKLLAEAAATARKGEVADDELLLEVKRIELAKEELASFEEQNRISMGRLALQAKALEHKIATDKAAPAAK